MKAITIAGNITKDSEVKTGGVDQTGFVTFSVAVNDGYGQNKTTMFFDCTMWGKRGLAIADYLKKGTKVTVNGELSSREYNGKTYLGIRVNDLALQGGKQQQSYDQSPSNDINDDIPF
jgi:single-strand DNA-binding protein